MEQLSQRLDVLCRNGSSNGQETNTALILKFHIGVDECYVHLMTQLFVYYFIAFMNLGNNRKNNILRCGPI